MKAYILLTLLTLGPDAQQGPSAQGFDTMQECANALGQWSLHMRAYSVRNHLNPHWAPIRSSETIGIAFAAGVASCSPYDELTAEGKAAADSSP